MDSNVKKKQAAIGFEPMNNGFANRRLRPLGYAAQKRIDSVSKGLGDCKEITSDLHEKTGQTGVVSMCLLVVMPGPAEIERDELVKGRIKKPS